MVVPLSGARIYVLLTRSPLSTSPKESFSFDLHALSTPLAFILSQDQTLHIWLSDLAIKLGLILNLLSELADLSATLTSFLSLFSC